MLRAILFILITIFLVTFLRMVIGIIMKSMGDMMTESRPSSSPQGRPPDVPLSGELKRDPVCGTFVPASTEFRKIVRGEAYHFCSADCRDKYA